MTAKIKGKVKFYNDTKGFGFITTDEDKVDIFVHASNLDAVDGYLEEGQSLLFTTIKGKKVIEAANVERG